MLRKKVIFRSPCLIISYFCTSYLCAKGQVNQDPEFTDETMLTDYWYEVFDKLNEVAPREKVEQWQESILIGGEYEKYQNPQEVRDWYHSKLQSLGSKSSHKCIKHVHLYCVHYTLLPNFRKVQSTHCNDSCTT